MSRVAPTACSQQQPAWRGSAHASLPGPCFPDDPITLSPMVEPLVLMPCGHSLCAQSFLMLWQHDAAFPHQQVCCPLCRTDIATFAGRFGAGAQRVVAYRAAAASISGSAATAATSILATPHVGEFSDAVMAMWLAYREAKCRKEPPSNSPLDWMDDVRGFPHLPETFPASPLSDEQGTLHQPLVMARPRMAASRAPPSHHATSLSHALLVPPRDRRPRHPRIVAMAETMLQRWADADHAGGTAAFYAIMDDVLREARHAGVKK